MEGSRYCGRRRGVMRGRLKEARYKSRYRTSLLKFKDLHFVPAKRQGRKWFRRHLWCTGPVVCREKGKKGNAHRGSWRVPGYRHPSNG